MTPPAETGGGIATMDLARLTKEKESIHNQLVQLRTICEKANNWNEIKPLFNKLSGGFDNFFVELGVT